MSKNVNNNISKDPLILLGGTRFSLCRGRSEPHYPVDGEVYLWPFWHFLESYLVTLCETLHFESYIFILKKRFFIPCHTFWLCFYMNLCYYFAFKLGLQRYTGAPVNRDIFCHDTNIDTWMGYRCIAKQQNIFHQK